MTNEDKTADQPRKELLKKGISQQISYEVAQGDVHNNPPEKSQLQLPPPKMGQWGYFLLVFPLCILNCVAAVGLWSSMGCDEDCLDFLRENEAVSYLWAFIAFVIGLVLYMLDFFTAPHIPNRRFLLAENDRLGPFLAFLGGFALVLACYFSAKSYPSAPLVITIYLLPPTLAWLRLKVKPEEPAGWKGEVVEQVGTFEDRMRMLAMLLEQERDEKLFYSATSKALASAGLVCALSWAIWAFATESGEHRIDSLDNTSSSDERREILIILWSAPGLVAASYFLFAVVSRCRVFLSRSYRRSNERRNELVLNRVEGEQRKVVLNQRISLLHEQLAPDSQVQSSLRADEVTKEQYLKQHEAYMKRLTDAFKFTICGFIVLLSLLYIVIQLVAAESHVAAMAQGFIGCFFLTVLGFVYFSFNRIFNSLMLWLVHVPLFKTALQTTQSDWFRAWGVCVSLPFIPFILVASVVNQKVRQLRGIYQKMPKQEQTRIAKQNSLAATISSTSTASSGTVRCAPSKSDGAQQMAQLLSTAVVEVGVEVSYRHGAACYEMKGISEKEQNGVVDAEVQRDSPERRLLTDRVHRFIQYALTWERVSIITKIYIWGLVLAGYTLTPRVLNVFLSWLTYFMESFSFSSILFITFLSGLVLFLLPPVPGAPVYLFGGVVITQKYKDIGGSGGFFMGALICILLGFFLKLTACAMQQKIIGENLGTSMWVRQKVMIHKPVMRALEAILSIRGLSFGKCVVLCGGPDWPTSVLCGLLNLSLWQCELGTFPIILYVAPLSLTGCFYVMMDEGEVYLKLGQLMFFLTMLMTVILWALIAWAVQSELDKNYERLTRPMEKYVDLDWMDHRATKVHDASVVKWQEVPSIVKFFFLTGALGVDMIAWGFYQFPTTFFGSFEVTDDFRKLKVYGNDGLVTPLGLYGLGILLVSCLGLFIFSRWHAHATADRVKTANANMDVLEANWKLRRIEEAREADRVAKNGHQGVETYKQAGKQDSGDGMSDDEEEEPQPLRIVGITTQPSEFTGMKSVMQLKSMPSSTPKAKPTHKDDDDSDGSDPAKPPPHAPDPAPETFGRSSLTSGEVEADATRFSVEDLAAPQQRTSVLKEAPLGRSSLDANVKEACVFLSDEDTAASDHLPSELKEEAAVRRGSTDSQAKPGETSIATDDVEAALPTGSRDSQVKKRKKSRGKRSILAGAGKGSMLLSSASEAEDIDDTEESSHPADKE